MNRKDHLIKDYFQVWTFNDQQIPLQHDDLLYLPVEMRWNLDASYDWLPKWKCLSTCLVVWCCWWSDWSSEFESSQV
jgi:hypothetical protein